MTVGPSQYQTQADDGASKLFRWIRQQEEQARVMHGYKIEILPFGTFGGSKLAPEPGHNFTSSTSSRKVACPPPRTPASLACLIDGTDARRHALSLCGSAEFFVSARASSCSTSGLCVSCCFLLRLAQAAFLADHPHLYLRIRVPPLISCLRI
ncbi:hypothetical protein ATANTOWER_012818 [Ataeniobius toweri]|uniref:Uncharacterized protein n=1 Tax=Ataeniobius toweri TaxID=208326 RepID=A0ABU7AJH2_9TELE|nr:hypothetical protein [Ataeniobius toweri]